jgi:hypothetical protein
MVVEGLSGTVWSAEERALYSGFRIGDSKLKVSHNQYVDDTIFFGESSVDNLYTLKAILQSFATCMRAFSFNRCASLGQGCC